MTTLFKLKKMEDGEVKVLNKSKKNVYVDKKYENNLYYDKKNKKYHPVEIIEVTKKDRNVTYVKVNHNKFTCKYCRKINNQISLNDELNYYEEKFNQYYYNIPVEYYGYIPSEPRILDNYKIDINENYDRYNNYHFKMLTRIPKIPENYDQRKILKEWRKELFRYIKIKEKAYEIIKKERLLLLTDKEIKMAEETKVIENNIKTIENKLMKKFPVRFYEGLYASYRKNEFENTFYPIIYKIENGKLIIVEVSKSNEQIKEYYFKLKSNDLYYKRMNLLTQLNKKRKEKRKLSNIRNEKVDENNKELLNSLQLHKHNLNELLIKILKVFKSRDESLINDGIIN